MSNLELPPLPSLSPDWDAIEEYRDAAAERERIMLARVAELEGYVEGYQGIVGRMEAKYSELLYAVVCKFPNESRHETALRYIRERECLPQELDAAIDAAMEKEAAS